jgi:DNA-binding NarL/FixJ family response regulator
MQAGGPFGINAAVRLSFVREPTGPPRPSPAGSRSLALDEASQNDAALSRRELEVLDHIQLGLTNRQIAQRLFVSTNTVNKHVQQVLRKLAVSNRVQAAIYARGNAK